jgi:hypothetical protein
MANKKKAAKKTGSRQPKRKAPVKKAGSKKRPGARKEVAAKKKTSPKKKAVIKKKAAPKKRGLTETFMPICVSDNINLSDRPVASQERAWEIANDHAARFSHDVDVIANT